MSTAATATPPTDSYQLFATILSQLTSSAGDADLLTSTHSFATGLSRVAHQFNTYSDTLSGGLFLGRGKGSRAVPTAVVSGTSLGTFGWVGYNTTDMDTLSAGINASPENTFSTTERRSAIRFFTAPAGAGLVTVKMRLSSLGNLRIGDDATATDRLEVVGNVVVSSAITVANSSVTASAFFGDGSHLSGIAGGSTEVSTNTLTGVLPASKGGTGNTTGTASAVSSGGVDFSTITTALAAKLGTSQAIGSAYVDLSTVSTRFTSVASDTTTIKTAMDTKLSSGAVPSGFVNLSTITTAIALKFDSAGGTLSGQVTLNGSSLTVRNAGFVVQDPQFNPAFSVTTSSVAIFGLAARLSSQTIAWLKAYTPGAVGESFYCNNCSPKKLVVSTGTAAGNFADSVGGTFK